MLLGDLSNFKVFVTFTRDLSQFKVATCRTASAKRLLAVKKSEELIIMKNLVLCHLTRWENFDGYGFFVLGKPFLTGILANFITYIIVLIQFQLTLQDPE